MHLGIAKECCRTAYVDSGSSCKSDVLQQASWSKNSTERMHAMPRHCMHTWTAVLALAYPVHHKQLQGVQLRLGIKSNALQ